MNIKLIATDVDGTLVQDDHLTVTQTNIDAFQKAKEKGIVIALSTGRTYKITDKEAEALGCVDYMILSNGAIILDNHTKEVIYNCYMPKEAAYKLVEIFSKYPLVFQMYASEKCYITQYTYDHFFDGDVSLPKEFMVDYRSRMIVCESFKWVVDNCNLEKINFDYIEPEVRKNLLEDLKQIPGLVYSAGYVGNLEITGPGADKGRALKWLADYLNIGTDEIMAFGDSGNDATMLSVAKHSYAMISGNDKAKAVAKNITRLSNQESGVGDTINQYLTKL